MKINHFIYLAGILVLVTLSGCGDPDGQIKKFTRPEDKTVATNYIALLRQKEFEPIKNDLDPSLKNTLTQDMLVKMAEAIPDRDPVSVKVVGAYGNFSPNLSQINLTFEYEFPSKWLLINVATQKKGGVSTIIGFHVYPLSDSLENLNKFTLKHKNLLQYATLMFAILNPVFCVSVLVLCIRTKMEKRKWLWAIFILIGVGTFTINWTSGQCHTVPLSVLLLGAGCLAPAYGAWHISISLPLGAILFLFRGKKDELIAPIEPIST